MKPFLRTMGMHALTMIGDPGCGKTFVVRATSLALSRRHKRIQQDPSPPELKSAPEFDFFSGEPGDAGSGWIYDDGTPADQTLRAIKSWADVGDLETMQWARWGAVKCVQGQPRAICEQQYNKAPFGRIPMGPFVQMKHEDWMMVLEETLPRTTEASAMALLKRSHLMINHKDKDGK